MFSFGTRIILLVLITAGTVAYIGDNIGKSIGKKRLSLLALRPRHTAIIITIITGMLIAGTTLSIIFAVSQNARTAFFGLEELKATLAEKTSLLKKTKTELSAKIADKEKIDQQLQAAKSSLNQANVEILTLEETRQKLKSAVEISRQGDVLFKVGDVLLVSLIEANTEKGTVELGLRQILAAADAHVRSLGVEGKKHLINVSAEEFNETVSSLQNSLGDHLIKVVATRNTLFGEEVPARFETIKNNLVYKKGEEIAELTIASSLSIPEIEQEIKRLLSRTHQYAKIAGVEPDANGAMGSVAYAKIQSLAKKINFHEKGVLLKALAKNDIFAIGPLEIKFRTYYQ